MLRRLRKILHRHWVYRRTIGFSDYLRYMTTPKGRPVTVTLGGRTIVVRKRTPDLRVAISSLCGEFRILSRLYDSDYQGVIINAGGYIGTAAIAFAEMYPKSTIVTIEPSSDNLAVLKSNVEHYPNIRVVAGALVSPRETDIVLKDRGKGEWGFTVVDSPADGTLAGPGERVEGYDLGSLGVDLDTVGILKLDIEGAEKDLFDHQTDSLSRIPFIVVELHDYIVPGCSASFFRASQGRWILKGSAEKYLSIHRA